VAVSEGAIRDAQRLVARAEGIWTAPESAALVAALGQLKDRGEALRDAEIMLIFTGAGIKYEPPALGTPTDLEGSEEEVLAKVRRTVGA
jgi:threonine synthase